MSRFRDIAYIAVGVAVLYNWFIEPNTTERPTPVAETASISNGKGVPIAPNPASLPADKLEIVGVFRYVTASSLRVRAGPSTTAEIRGSLAKGTRVVVIENAGEWLKVGLEDGRQGWAHGDYLSASTPLVSASTRTAPAPISLQRHDAAIPRAELPGRDTIAQEIIERSIARYPGTCACPYSRDRAGRSCGRRSAYSRAGGEAPLCYRGDVTNAMIEAYR